VRFGRGRFGRTHLLPLLCSVLLQAIVFGQAPVQFYLTKIRLAARHSRASFPWSYSAGWAAAGSSTAARARSSLSSAFLPALLCCSHALFQDCGYASRTAVVAGANVTTYSVPSELRASYGAHPAGFNVFLRLRLRS
jgi:hypothetical protein